MLQKFHLKASHQWSTTGCHTVLLNVFTKELSDGAAPLQQIHTQYRTGRNSLCRSWVCRWVCYYSGAAWQMEKWTDKKLKMFNKRRHQILHHAPEQAWGWPSGKELGREGCMSFLLDNKLSMSKQCFHEPNQGCRAEMEPAGWRRQSSLSVEQLWDHI